MTTDRPSALMVDLLFGVSDSKLGTPSGFVPTPPFTGASHKNDDNSQPEACQIVAVSLSSYLDAELDQDQDDMIENHLNHCNDCNFLLEAMIATDSQIQREWRENTPLPSSRQVQSSIDSIMEALPQAPSKEPLFAPKRVHARARWTRFAAGLTGVFSLIGLPCATYFMGYQNGKRNSEYSKSPSSAFNRFSPKITLNQSFSPQTASLNLSRLKAMSP